VLVVGAATASADPPAEITQFSSGLSAGSQLLGIAPGPGGDLWFTVKGLALPSIGRITPSGRPRP
jgi:hypothetical protein